MSDLDFNLKDMREFFESGKTVPYQYRKDALELFKKAIIKYEADINSALYSDLKKSKEETWASETGLLLSEISNAIKNLRKWMKPRKVNTGLVTFPSSAKIYREPLGVVLIISPWNYPLQLLLVPLVGAIAGGNCVVLKPSELAPGTANLIKKIFCEIFSDEYIKVYLGEGRDLIPAMIEHFHFDHIFYTGSIAVGKSIYQMAARDLIPVTLELGGKSPAIIESDANLTVAAKRIIIGKFINAGQTCVAPDYLL